MSSGKTTFTPAIVSALAVDTHAAIFAGISPALVYIYRDDITVHKSLNHYTYFLIQDVFFHPVKMKTCMSMPLLVHRDSPDSHNRPAKPLLHRHLYPAG